MEVNIKAISDALDDIFAAEAGFKSNKAHSAIIHRQPILLSKSNIDRSRGKRAKPVAPEESAAANGNSVTGSSIGAEKSPSSEKRLIQLKQASLSDGNEKTEFINKSERKSMSPELSKPHERERPPTQNSAGKSLDAEVAKFLELLERVEVVPFRAVEATGIGVRSVILTPRSVDRVISRSQLPSKSWLTNISLARKASALFELENRADIRRNEEPPSHSSVSQRNQPGEDSTASFVIQNFLAVLVIEDDTGRDSPAPQSSSAPNGEQHLFSVTIKTSSSQRGVFSVAASASAISGCVTTLEIPSALLNTFVQLTISPLKSQPTPKFIKVRAICIFRPETSAIEKRIHTQVHHQSLEENVEVALPEGIETARQSERSVRRSAQKKGPAETKPTQPPSIPLTKHGDVAHLTWSSHDSAVSVASYVKGVALTRLRQQSSTPKQPSSGGGDKVEYDWLLDTLVNVSAKREGAHDGACRKASMPSKECETATGEYIRALQAWNCAPALSAEAALTFCLSETTSFSVSTIYATGLFSHEAQNHFLQPFKLHFFVVSGTPDVDKSSMRAYALGIPVPPVHFLSAIAGQTALLGYTAELLFTCPENNGFVCALRPYSCTPGTHYKLLFVVLAHSNGENKDDTASVTKGLLRTALSIFCDPARARGRLLSQDTAFPFHRTVSRAKPCGALRLLIDGTCCLDDLMPVFSEWAKVAGGLRYYGSAAQRTVQLLFFPFHLGSSDGNSERLSVVSEPRKEAQWSRLRLWLLGLWKKDTNETDSVADDIVALEVDYHCPATYVWQSRRGALRLVLTDAHFMEYITRVDGLVASSSLVSLVRGYYGSDVNGSTHMPMFSTLSEAPWTMLLNAAEKMRHGSVVSVTSLGEGAAVDFFALRRRVTVSFAFHVLSTAFKRGWARVSASLPLCNGHIRGDMRELQSVHLPVLASSVGSENGMGGALKLLDEDAFMDTLLQWQYPFPNVVVLHCTNVLHAVTGSSSASTTARCPPYSLVQEGVMSFFSEEVLRSFGSVSKPEEALS
ncbi:hypothetical protein JKF63_02578 [Porcisia hertigi]|uniref:Uncharacterized protein n=1 Tax=Porcisia hertigi TaxID=2761500 RepID=A0A836I181_9TRYP|nr:hypothetical protein JKF63_02578 [Porcisia hertigi]